jgi:UDP-N-acetylglucosamine acyltransferase
MIKAKIHPTAIISENVKLGADVEIGAYSILDGNITLGDGCRIMEHCVIRGKVTMGKHNKIFQFCSIGEAPQDLSYKGEETEVIIGDNNTIREFVSIHRGTTKENRKTILGNNCLLMAKVHIAHDAVVGNNCVIVNSVNLAGHVKLGDRVTIGGGTNISQFVTLGRGAYIGGASGIDRDIPMFCTAYGNRAKLKGINIVGLRRQGYSKQQISELVDFFRTIEASALSPRAFVDHQDLMQDFKNNELIDEMVQFIKKSEIGLAPFVS